jgi:hypothetical protein
MSEWLCPVGYGLILAGVQGVRTESSFGLTWAASLRITCARSYRTLRDGFFLRTSPGTSCQATIGESLRDALADALWHYLGEGTREQLRNSLRRAKNIPNCS